MEHDRSCVYVSSLIDGRCLAAMCLWLLACGSGTSKEPADAGTYDAISEDALVDANISTFGTYLSGERLQLRLISDEESLGLFEIFDPNLDNACRPKHTLGGTVKCVPGLYSTLFGYTDAECSRELTFAYFEEGVLEYIYDAGGWSGFEIRHLHKVSLYDTSIGGVVGGPGQQPVYRLDELGVCVAMSVEFDGRIYTKDQEIPLASLVTLERETQGTPETIYAVDWVGSDGARIPIESLFTGTSDTPCAVVSGTDGTKRCAPSIWHDPPLFWDDQCKSLANFAETEKDVFAILSTPATCPPTYSFYAYQGPGDGHEELLYTFDDSGACVLSDFNCPACDKLAKIDDGETGTEVSTEVVGSGRLQRVVASNDVVKRAVQWWDTDFSSRCIPERRASGEIRCMPKPVDASGQVNLYTDQACSGDPAAGFLDGYRVQCVSEATYSTLEESSGEISIATSFVVFETGEALYSDRYGTCSPGDKSDTPWEDRLTWISTQLLPESAAGIFSVVAAP